MDKKTLRKLDPWFWVKKILPRTLFARSLLIIVIPVLLLQGLTTLVFVDNHWRKITSRLAFAVAGEVAIIADDLSGSASQGKIDTISSMAAQKLDLLITFESGKKLQPSVTTHGTWEPFTVEALSKALTSQVRRPYSLSFSPEDDWVNIGIQLDNGVLRVLVLERRLYSTSAYIFLLWVMAASVVLFAVSVLFMRNQIRPIRRLAIIAERMGKGQEVHSFKPEGAWEVRQAATAFLQMHERITRAVEQRTAMLAGISHDLRTPLTRLKLGLSLLGGGEDIDALKQDITDMERMVESYINFVRGEGQELTQQVLLHELLGKIVESTRRHGTKIILQCADNIKVNVRPLAFERCIQNVVSNAEKYGKNIWVT
ncbi:MAG: histidine kinase dimerization/phospho-acceptor domain-containing protein, partial [Pseudomonadota bacterium]